jgi:3-hydroxy acid dehydrogenase/malonic semialdehyde reductase
MVENEFSLVRFRGDKDAADKVYQGFSPRMFSLREPVIFANFSPVTAKDITEKIVWAASRPPHVNSAELVLCSLFHTFLSYKLRYLSS